MDVLGRLNSDKLILPLLVIVFIETVILINTLFQLQATC